MVQRRYRSSLVLEPSHPISVRDLMRRQHLQRELSSQSLIFGEVDLAHGARSEERQNTVMRDRPARDEVITAVVEHFRGSSSRWCWRDRVSQGSARPPYERVPVEAAAPISRGALLPGKDSPTRFAFAPLNLCYFYNTCVIEITS